VSDEDERQKGQTENDPDRAVKRSDVRGNERLFEAMRKHAPLADDRQLGVGRS
jgi:hypothetical protein